jgi:hypothetical protein
MVMAVGNDQFSATVLGVVAAALPGVFVALFAQYLAQRHEAQVERRLNATQRLMVAGELAHNREALRAFWQEISALDSEPQSEGAESHLAQMYKGGLLNAVLPAWSFVRWESLPTRALGALSPKEAAVIEQVYRELRTISDLYARLVTLTPDERAQIEAGGSVGRFWYNYVSTWRLGTFERLEQAVQRVGTAPELDA